MLHLTPTLAQRLILSLALGASWLVGWSEERVSAQPSQLRGPTNGAVKDPPRRGPQPWRRRPSLPASAPARATAAPPTSPRPWTVEGDAWDTDFGYYATPAGDVNGDGCADVLVSEPGFDGRRGRVLTYYGSPTGLSTRPDWTLAGTLAPPAPVVHVRADGLGDVNGDGYDDVVAVFYHGVVTNGLRLDWAEVFLGSTTGLVAQAGWQITAEELSVSTILHTSRAGDVNGDGYSDLRLLATVKPTDGPPYYQMFVFHGSAGGLRRVPNSSWKMMDTFKDGGPDLSCAGDVNGDGCDDLLVGDPYWSQHVHGEGRLLLFLGSLQGLQAAPVWTAFCELPIRKGLDEAYERFYGWSVASAGDVNGDGLADIITGAPFTEHGDVNEGMAFIYHGSTNGLGPHPAWSIESNQIHALLGYSVSGAGDVNGDGYADVIVGAPQAEDNQIQEGAALVFLGSANGLRRKAHWCVESDHSNAHLGRVVCGIGDANGDGFDDVLVTTPDFARDGQRVGRVSVFYGSGAGLTDSADWSIGKPFLIAAEQWLTRTSTLAKLSALGALLALIVGLAWAWRRALHRALRAEHALALQAERTRIARDLHDGLGADLARLRALDNSASGGPDSLATTVQAALQSAEQAVWTVNPANDTLENLVAFLLQQAGRQFSGTSVRCLTDAPPDLPELQLPAAVRQHLFLAVKEAFTNVLKHAQATEARLRITFTAPLLEIVVQDNGIGLPAGPTRRFGNGLKNLQQRMAQVGGQVEFSSRPDGGTRVVFQVKLGKR